MSGQEQGLTWRADSLVGKKEDKIICISITQLVD